MSHMDRGDFGTDKGAPKWWSRTIKKGGVLGDINHVPGMTVSMLCLGALVSSCGRHMDFEGLEYIKFRHDGSTKVWYIFAACERYKFENFVRRNV